MQDFISGGATDYNGWMWSCPANGLYLPASWRTVLTARRQLIGHTLIKTRITYGRVFIYMREWGIFISFAQHTHNDYLFLRTTYVKFTSTWTS